MNYKNEKLIAAARRKQVEFVKELLVHGANVNHTNNNGETALIAAAIYGRVEEVKNLLLQGANPNYENEHGYTALMWATEKGNVELVKVLLNAPDINVNLATKKMVKLL